MNDFILTGLLLTILFLVFFLESQKNKYIKIFFTFFPPLILCYFLPSIIPLLLKNFDLSSSKVPTVGTQLLLPSCLILFCLNLNLKELYSLGPKLLIMFFISTISVIIGGPIAFYVFTHFFQNSLPCTVDDLWKGLSTIAGSWIGGSVNQTAMKEIYKPSESLFAAILVVDVAVASIWMSLLLFLASKKEKIDSMLKSNDKNFNLLVKHISKEQKILKNSTTLDLFKILAVSIGGTALAHLITSLLVEYFSQFNELLVRYHLETLTFPFFWLVLIATLLGILGSMTTLRKLHEVGSMHVANVMLYFLITTIGLKMDLSEIHLYLPLIGLGILWMFIHALVIFTAGYFLKMPLFYIATSSMANIGGAASAPVVASAFNPQLAPIGVLLAILGYAVGNYGAILSTWIMQSLSH